MLTGTCSVSVAWRQRGWNDGRWGRSRSTSVPEEHRPLYNAGYRQGKIARAHAQR